MTVTMSEQVPKDNSVDMTKLGETMELVKLAGTKPEYRLAVVDVEDTSVVHKMYLSLDTLISETYHKVVKMEEE